MMSCLIFTKSAAELERPRNTWDECVNYVIGELNSLIESPYMKSQLDFQYRKGLGYQRCLPSKP